MKKASIKNSLKKHFLWGVTSIGTQTEGGCATSNWYRAACEGTVPEIGCANNYWEDYAAHHDEVEELGVGALRISLEWARIEPEEGVYDYEVIDRYRAILRDIRRRDIVTMVGLFHWSFPAWCTQDKGGLHDRHFADHFIRFSKIVRDTLAEEIDLLLILNEPMVPVYAGYVEGTHPPHQKRSPYKGLRAMHTMISMHRRVHALWKEKYPHTSIGSTHLWNDVRWHKKTLWGHLFNAVMRWIRVEYFVFRTYKKSDFLGINYYTSNRFFFGMSGGRMGFHGTNDWHDPDVWRYFAQGLGVVLMDAAHYGLPIYICENGKPTNDVVDDEDRQIFLTDCVEYVLDAREKNIDVRGYFHYALMDSYEWSSGYDFLFGLVSVNRGTLEKTKRKSFDVYKEMIKTYEIKHRKGK